MYREITVSPGTPMPIGYAFVPKGIAYKTLHCRKLTREAGELLYIVVDKNKTLGLRAPQAIVSVVHFKAKDTLAARRAAVQKRDDADISKATTELQKQFPAIPGADKGLVLKHGFKKHSGRVGRTGSLPLHKKVMLAVIAHIRHMHSNYDALLRAGQPREVARKATWKTIEGVMREWGCSETPSWYVVGKKPRNWRKKDPQRLTRSTAKRQKRESSSAQSEDSDDQDSEYEPWQLTSRCMLT